MRIVLVILLSLIISPTYIFGRSPENGTSFWYRQKLYTDLLHNYLPALRPAINQTHSVPINVMSFRFWSINELDEQQQIMSSVSYLRLTWEDFRLKWNPKDYEDLNEIEIPMKELWYPDVYVDNSKEASLPVTTSDIAVVSSDGKLRWEHIMNLKTHCFIDLSYFPYDSHNCSMYLSLWSYDSSKAHLVMHGDNSSFCTYATPHDWVPQGCGARQSDFGDVYEEEDAQNLTFSMIDYWIVLERSSGFTNHLFVAPAVLLCLITPVIFILPPASTEKMIFGSGVLVSNVILLGELVRFLPTAHPTLPYIGKYMLSNIVLCCLSLIISACIVNIWGKRSTSTTGPPQLIVTIFLGSVARWLYATADQFSESLESADDAESKTTVRMSNTTNAENLQFSGGTGDGQALAPHIYSLRIARLQWHQLAVVIDRIFLILYPIVLAFLTLVFAIYI